MNSKLIFTDWAESDYSCSKVLSYSAIIRILIKIRMLTFMQFIKVPKVN